MRDRTRELLTLLPLVDGRPDAMVALARQLRGVGENIRALDLAARALAFAPGDGEVRALALEVLSDGVPRWHFGLLRDVVRNQAYEDALRRTVTAGCRVFEIGTGSGLLAMMAARAGAGEVVTCEVDPAVAAAARDVIAANGLSDRICVINKHSSAVDLADLGGLADVLVSEIVSNDLLSEGVLPAYEDAKPRLLKPGAAVIPARGRIRVALAEVPGGQRPTGEVSGFDLSAFNRLARPYLEIPVGSPHLTLRSEPADLFVFDFAADGPWYGERRELRLESTGGAVSGVVQWIALEMDAVGRYENRPGEASGSCWACIYWPFVNVKETVRGQSVKVHCRHERDRIHVWSR